MVLIRGVRLGVGIGRIGEDVWSGCGSVQGGFEFVNRGLYTFFSN